MTKNTKTTMKRKQKNSGNKTRKNVPWRGWSQQKPSYKQRSEMLRKCGKKYFLGPKKSFPVCKKNTCDVSDKGLWAAYIRAKEWGNKPQSYKGSRKPTKKRSTYERIAKKSRKMLKNRGYTVN